MKRFVLSLGFVAFFGVSAGVTQSFQIPEASQNEAYHPEITKKIRLDSVDNVVVDASLNVNGNTTTRVLTITGGADLAEPFLVNEAESVSRGSVVVIDSRNPGFLKLSHKPYDKCVAGVVSGAGGMQPGLTLRQNGTLDQGVAVALTGRVYVHATASNGSIQPGDLLTTSEIPGFAMKATDRQLTNGAILGKAMTPLQDGKGFILVLVNLQ